MSTASYAARELGIGSGMPLRVARRKCPDAVFLPVDAPAYEAVSRTLVMETLRSLSWGGVPVLVQVLGWDEAFVGPGPGHADLGDPEEMAEHVMASVLEATGLHCSVGIGDNTLRAKNATDFGKPRGTYMLTAANWLDVMGDRSTRALWGIGAKTAAKLAGLGIETVAQLAASDPAVWQLPSGRRWGRTTAGWRRARRHAPSTPSRTFREPTDGRRRSRRTWTTGTPSPAKFAR